MANGLEPDSIPQSVIDDIEKAAYVKLSTLLKALLKKKGWTQAELAEIVSTETQKIDESFIYRLFHAKSGTIEKIDLIMQKLLDGVTVDELLKLIELHSSMKKNK